jgi:bifunctional non-homologous end joining protein LigD
MLATPGQAHGNSPAQDFRKLMATGEWLADTKIDGVRAWALWNGERMQFRNRNGVDITHRYPELDFNLGPDPMWLDGEIQALDGSFETTLVRDQQEFGPKIKGLARLHPTRFIAFDVPMYDTWSYIDRRAFLEDFLDDDLLSVHLGISTVSDEPDFLDTTRDLGLEGAIVKRRNSRYVFGKRARTWIKFKNVRRITCLVAGYLPGTGSRAEFGSMRLALIDNDGTVVDVGTVGTGFTQYQIQDLKARLDRGDLLVAEIECLNRTSGNKLRFPVYKGLRSDVPLTACTTQQLDELPVC